MVQIRQKVFSVVLSSAMLASMFFGNLGAASMSVSAKSVTPPRTAAATATASYSSNGYLNDYGLAKNAQDGTILHAWNWYFKDVTNNIKQIQQAGYSSVQVSPVQKEKSNQGLPNLSSWWAFYQPENFKVGNILGTREDFRTMCKAAHDCGIKIIVDVVANHMANNKHSDSDDEWSRWGLIDPQILNNESFWHRKDGHITDNNRWDITQKSVGEPDLNTGNKGLQNIILGFLNDAQSLGADGFRYDCAKHIELPTDGACASDFWPTIINGLKAKNPNVYNYGEIMQPSGYKDAYGNSDDSYYTPYMSITASTYGINMRQAVRERNAEKAKELYFSVGPYTGPRKVGPEKLVAWVETHDTYASNGHGESMDMSDTQLKLGWGLVAGRTKIASLFFVRPQNGLSGNIGGPGSPLWHSKEVVAINKFHNAMIGENEDVRADGSVFFVQRGTKGILITNMGGDTDINFNTVLSDGTYTDQISGSKFNVSSGRLTGHVSGETIAAVYNDVVVGEPNATATPGSTSTITNFINSQEITLKTNDATKSATYSIDGAAAQSFTNGDKITIGADAAIGSTITLTLTASDGTKTSTATYSYKKIKQAVVAPGTAVLQLPSGWSTPKIYVYDDSGAVLKTISSWPGVDMTAMPDVGENCYGYTLPSDWTTAKVIFTDGVNQIPSRMQPGLTITNKEAKIYKDGSWQDLPIQPTEPTEPTEPSASSSVASGTVFTTETMDVTLSLANATSGTYTIDNGSATTFNNNTTISIGSNTPSGGTVTLKLTATNGTKTTTTTYTYTKKTTTDLTVNSLITFPGTTAAVGTNVMLAADATGGTGKLQYEFVLYDGISWKTISSYSESNTALWVPKAAGNYKLAVQVIDSSGTVKSKDIAFTVKDSAALTINSFTANPVSSNKIQLTTDAVGGVGTLNYKFMAYDGNAWHVIQEYAPSNTVTWEPASAGTYELYACVKDSTNKVVIAGYSYTVNS